ncbi:glutamine synthetase [Isachenkonia alkalipeptolytica]|uniref:glutamine synthetase n=1 Tax=Isachenkonia alkalipeptolytica TaxID=2565777 RepID=A0AA43XNE2_9CLOT|nr:glutamine synthetase [Isachenkonia alkalipeptolytica]NBG89509.1 glutamine synthetase [Isachenkonia alkalipeptolytica]
METELKEILSKEKLFTLPPWTHQKKYLKEILSIHSYIKFVSLVGVDLGGNDTDEKIPVSLFLKELDSFLKEGVQTDGSSVILHKIATLNNAKVDLIPDLEVNWFVDYNYYYEDSKTNMPLGTLRIPAFLKHDGKMVDSRSILKRAENYFEEFMLESIHRYKNGQLKDLYDRGVKKVLLTTATELEFWVKTPEESADEEKLTTSQMLKEQYWKRTKGNVRTALEEVMIILEDYGFGPEMAHKEVGGVTAKIGLTGKFNHVMEQLEVDWKYSTALQAADNELFIRELIEEVFEFHGLEVTFSAKPIEGVAGSGKHTHVGVQFLLNNGEKLNAFVPENIKKDFLNPLGWGAFIGILNNYDVINPFINSTNDAFNRLKPGFEAPVSIVGSVGHTPEIPSRNRTVLIGLVRDIINPHATRFELRSPSPNSNTYVYVAAMYQSMLDGIKEVLSAGLSGKEVEAEFSKSLGEEKFYLDKDRVYRSEEDVFDDYSEGERERMFGKSPATVWECIHIFNQHYDKKQMLYQGGVFEDNIIDSIMEANLDIWVKELIGRILPENTELVRSCRRIHGNQNLSDLDVVNWEKINGLRYDLMKDRLDQVSLFSKIKKELEGKNYLEASKLQQEMQQNISKLKVLYGEYRKNLLEDMNGLNDFY